MTYDFTDHVPTPAENDENDRLVQMQGHPGLNPLFLYPSEEAECDRDASEHMLGLALLISLPVVLTLLALALILFGGRG